jgi:hypothetical protein
MSRRGPMNALGRLLPSLVRGTDDGPEARECAAFTAWNGAAGAGVRRASTPVRLDARLLVVATVDQTWKTQLERLAPQLIFRINSLLGAALVTRIAFRVDPAAVAAAHGPAVAPAFEPGDEAGVAADLARDAETISDPALREAFLRAASRCLARAEAMKRQR